MSEELYNIVLTGDIRAGFKREEVIGRLARMTKRSPATIEKLFQRPEPAIARNVARGDVRLYLAKVGKTGAVAKAQMMHGAGGAPFPPLHATSTAPLPPAPAPENGGNGGYVLEIVPLVAPELPEEPTFAAPPKPPSPAPASARPGTARKQQENTAGNQKPGTRKGGAGSQTTSRKTGKPRRSANASANRTDAGGLRAVLERFTQGRPHQSTRGLGAYIILALAVVILLLAVFMLL